MPEIVAMFYFNDTVFIFGKLPMCSVIYYFCHVIHFHRYLKCEHNDLPARQDNAVLSSQQWYFLVCVPEF